jgi:hypothetical protein
MNVMLENNTCGEIRLYDATPSHNASVPDQYVLKQYYTKAGCTLTNSTKSATSRRLFLSNFNKSAIYIAGMEVWFR